MARLSVFGATQMAQRGKQPNPADPNPIPHPKPNPNDYFRRCAVCAAPNTDIARWQAMHNT